MDTRIGNVEHELTSLMGKLTEYEQQQATWKSGLANQVAHETGKVVGGLEELHRKVEQTLNMFNERMNIDHNALDERLKVLERDGKSSERNQGKSLLTAKEMKPATLD